jgi:probable selenium-dependent hydroxylase accessory protein YqeC
MKTKLIDTLQLTGQGLISIIGAGGKTSLKFRLAKEHEDSGKSVLTTTTRINPLLQSLTALLTSLLKNQKSVLRVTFIFLPELNMIWQRGN